MCAGFIYSSPKHTLQEVSSTSAGRSLFHFGRWFPAIVPEDQAFASPFLAGSSKRITIQCLQSAAGFSFF